MRYISGGAMTEDRTKEFVAEGGGNQAMVAAVLKPEDKVIWHLSFHLWFHHPEHRKPG